MNLNVVRFALAWAFNLLIGAVALVLAVPLGPERTWRLLAQFWGRTVLRLEKVKLDVKGAEHFDRPAVLIINHLSLIDAVYVPALLPRTVKFVIKKELARIPLWGWAIRATGAILIDRKSPRTAMESIRQGVRTLPPGWSVVVFPEGTRSPDGTLQRFKKGAFYVALESRLPVIPIGAAGPLDIVPKGTLVVRPGTVHVTVGEPISTENWSYATLEAHVKQAHEAVARCIEESERRRNARIQAHPRQTLPVKTG